MTHSAFPRKRDPHGRPRLPIGEGQRGLIVAPPKAGKTTLPNSELLRQIRQSR